MNPELGIIEGFYGNPWTGSTRGPKRQFPARTSALTGALCPSNPEGTPNPTTQEHSLFAALRCKRDLQKLFGIGTLLSCVRIGRAPMGSIDVDVPDHADPVSTAPYSSLATAVDSTRPGSSSFTLFFRSDLCPLSCLMRSRMRPIDGGQQTVRLRRRKKPKKSPDS